MSVTLLDRSGGAHRYNSLAFELRGMIRVDPYPLEFMVQSTLDLESSRMHAAIRR